MKKLYRLLFILIFLVVASASMAMALGLIPRSSPPSTEPSICFGTTAEGRLIRGVQLPAEGNNYIGYSSLGRFLGRTYVHSEVRDIVVAAFKDLETEQPNKVYKYAETGFKNGGRIRPHVTHRNGLTVDFMTPVLDQNGRSVHLPTHLFNKLGYNIEFDENNEYDGLNIDYEALAAQVVALHKQAKSQGHDLWRVIFDPQLQPGLYKTKYADYLRANIQFSQRPSWVRHDEHYHVDFAVKCQ